MAGDGVFHNEYIILVVVGIILFGLCTGLCAFTWRNRQDLWLLIAIPLHLDPAHKNPIEEATEQDRIIFERAEKKRREREEREEALREAADPDKGSDESPPSAPAHDLEDPRSHSRNRAGSKGRSGRNGSKGSTAATDSSTSQAFVKHKGRKSSRASEPGVHRHDHEGDSGSRSISVPAGARKMARVSPLTIGDAEDPLNLSDASQIAALADNQRKHAERGRRHSISTTTGADLMRQQLHDHLQSPTGGSLPLRGYHRPPPPSGAWKGTLMERTHQRTNKYDLRFLGDNELIGSTQGPDGFAAISGTFDPSSKRVTWVERHPWGTVEATGHVFYSHHVAQITGSFTASDGGKGKLQLSPDSS
mmetsp:Transcript_119498/g.283698  ORF Transcript_119498/g.283698 Transcript_119498/m.283698 type:complete len:362 (-) Transcript_119498:403-1488(-)